MGYPTGPAAAAGLEPVPTRVTPGPASVGPLDVDTLIYQITLPVALRRAGYSSASKITRHVALCRFILETVKSEVEIETII